MECSPPGSSVHGIFQARILEWVPGIEPVSLIYPALACEGFPGGSAGEESACNVGDLGSVPGLGRSPGEGKG